MSEHTDGAARKTCGCKGKGKSDGAAAEAPVFLKDMQAVDRALVRAVRLWAASGGDAVKVGVLFSDDTGTKVPDSVLAPLAALMESMDEDGGPEIALREPSCGKTTPAERAVVRLVTAMGDGDAAAAQACAGALVTPARSRRVMRDAFILAAALESVGRPAAAAPVVASGGAGRALC